MSLGRLPRAFVFFAFWWSWLFLLPDYVWPHLPWWMTLARFVAWVVACNHLPGYSRFVTERGVQTSDVVPQTPTAPLVGWRAWHIGDGTIGLRSMTSPETWPADQPIRATCLLDRWRLGHRAPAPDCHCGIYAFAGPSEASAIRLGYRIAVYGPVLMWGRTQVHETGWRSQYARPLD